MTKEEAIEVYNQLINTKIKEAFEFFVPELKVSEDDRVIEMLRMAVNQTVWLDEDKNRCYRWLNKQGEEKAKSKNLMTQEEREAVYEQKPAWSEEDEKHINSLLERLKGLCKNEFTRTTFAVSEDEDWLKSLRNIVLPQAKQEWGEEDEIHQLHTISLIEDIKDWANKDGMHSLCIERCIESIDWLILLKERCCPQIGDYHEGFEKGFAKAKAMNCHWKPSDEQIKQLNITVNMLNPNRHDKHVLTSLLEDLKKL